MSNFLAPVDGPIHQLFLHLLGEDVDPATLPRFPARELAGNVSRDMGLECIEELPYCRKTIGNSSMILISHFLIHLRQTSLPSAGLSVPVLQQVPAPGQLLTHGTREGREGRECGTKGMVQIDKTGGFNLIQLSNSGT